MKHPTPDELSAFHDGLLGATDLVAVELHVNECAACRDALEALEHQDRALAATLAHDPGDAHFDALAARIERDLAAYAPGRRAAGAASGAGGARGGAGAARGAGETRGAGGGASAGAAWRRLAGAAVAARERFGAILAAARGNPAAPDGGARKTRVPSWAGAAAALVVAVGLLVLNLERAPSLRDPALERRVGQAADRLRDDRMARDVAPEAVPPRGGAGAREVDRRVAALEERAGDAPLARSRAAMPQAGTPKPSGSPAAPSTRANALSERTLAAAPPAAAPSPAGSAPGASPARAYEVKRTASGEDMRVRKQEGVFAKAPPATTEAEGGRTVPLKPQFAQPLAGSPPKSDAKESASTLAKDESSAVPGEPSVVRMCGVVKDSFGRPIPSASVTIATRGSGTTADAQGRFCIETPPGEHTLSVFAVGFAPLHFEVSVAPGAQPLALTLHAVPVIEDAAAKAAMLKALSGVPQTGSPEDGLRGHADSLQPVASRAMRLTLAAERAKSAAQYEAAAVEWERVRARAAGQPLELEARFRIAETRYHAWELAPTERRASAANEALTSFLVRAPLGAQRDRATVWLGKVK